jgi:hypothetical protein
MRKIAVLLLPALLLLAPVARATTQCDTDASATPFESTVDESVINALISTLDPPAVDLSSGVNLDFPGLCTDHRVNLYAALFAVPIEGAPFNVTPFNGGIAVDLFLGPFSTSIGTRNYTGINCSSTCVVEIPYTGITFNGCSIESAIVRPVVNNQVASASWTDTDITQIADTCILSGDCSVIQPLEVNNVNLVGFDVDATGFGDCEVCIDFPDPFPDPPCLDPCAGLDPLIEALLEPVFENAFEGALVDENGNGVVVEIFALQIAKDFFGCFDDPAVRECKRNLPLASAAGAGRSFNAVFYLLPLALAGGLAFRLRRRKR